MSKEQLEDAKELYGLWLDSDDKNEQNEIADEFIYRFAGLLIDRVQELKNDERDK